MPKVGLRDVVPKDIHRVQVEFVWFIPRLVGHISKAINNVSDYIYSAVFVGHTPSFGGQFPVSLLEYIYIYYIYHLFPFTSSVFVRKCGKLSHKPSH